VHIKIFVVLTPEPTSTFYNFFTLETLIAMSSGTATRLLITCVAVGSLLSLAYVTTQRWRINHPRNNNSDEGQTTFRLLNVKTKHWRSLRERRMRRLSWKVGKLELTAATFLSSVLSFAGDASSVVVVGSSVYYYYSVGQVKLENESDGYSVN